MILMTALARQRKTLALILVTQRQNFAWVCITMEIIFICLLMEKRLCKFKAGNKNANLPT